MTCRQRSRCGRWNPVSAPALWPPLSRSRLAGFHPLTEGIDEVKMPNLSDVTDIGDKLGIFQAVKEKLLKQPDPAAQKLVTVLDEIYKIYSSLEAELPQFLALSFDASDPEGLAQERAKLLSLEGGEITARMGQTRGHCAKIGNIYTRYLSPWFQRVLQKADIEMLGELFRSLDQFDGKMVVAVDQVADWLTKESAAVLNLVDAQDYVAAEARVRAARHLILPQRRATAKTMRGLLDLQAEFIELSGAL